MSETYVRGNGSDRVRSARLAQHDRTIWTSRAGRDRVTSTRPQTGLRILAGVVLVVALVGAGVGAAGFMQASRARSQIDVLQADLSRLQGRVSAADRGTASERLTIASLAAQATGAQRSLKRLSWQLQSAPTEAELARVRGDLVTYEACMSQVQNEIAGLGISRTPGPSKSPAGYAGLFTRAPVSASCSVALTGH